MGTAMNFLAHLFLADRDPGGLIGALLPDLVRGRAGAGLDGDIAAGVALHRWVDRFTDMHPAVAASKRRLGEAHRRYAGIIVDIHYDHCLASDFERYADETLDGFVSGMYGELAAHAGRMPESMRAVVEWMIEQDWLRAYATLEGVAVILGQLSGRLSERFGRAVDLTSAVGELRREAGVLRGDFEGFFPALQTAASDWRAGHGVDLV